jgi:hypothetical protein
MKPIWNILNIGLLTLGFWGGYRSTEPGSLRHANPDPVLWLVILLIMPLFSIGSVYYSTRRWRNILSRPSWDRNPVNWWPDPLQSLFFSMCFMATMAIGAALRRPAIDSVGFRMVGIYGSTAIGLVVGQLLVYRIYRRHIAKE